MRDLRSTSRARIRRPHVPIAVDRAGRSWSTVYAATVVLFVLLSVSPTVEATHSVPTVFIGSDAPSPGGVHLYSKAGLETNRVYGSFDVTLLGIGNLTWEIWLGNQMVQNGTGPNGSVIWMHHVVVDVPENVRRTPLWVVLGNQTWDYGTLRVSRASLHVTSGPGDFLEPFLELTEREYAASQWRAFAGPAYTFMPGMPLIGLFLWRWKSREVQVGFRV